MNVHWSGMKTFALSTLATVLVLSSVLGPGTASEAQAADPVTYAVGRAVTRFLFGTVPHRARDYREINRNKNLDLAEVANVQRTREYQRDRGWLSEAAYQQEQQRLQSWRAGIIDRAEREKRITKYDYDHAIGREARTAVQGALTGIPGVDPVAAKFVSNVIGGQDPLNAALNALNDPSRPVTDQLAVVKAQLGDTQAAFDSLKKHLRDPNAVLRQEVERLSKESGILADPGSSLPPSELRERANKLRQEISETRNAIKAAWKDLTGSDVKINKDRFARDDKWLEKNANVQALEDVTDATKAVIAARIRERQESTEESVRTLLVEAGITADDAAVARMASEAISAFLKAEMEARASGEDPTKVDRDKLLREIAGVKPKPSEEVTPPAGESVTPEPETVTPVPSVSPEPSAEPTETPPPPPPPPSPTATATPEPIRPIVVASGSFSDEFNITFSLTINFTTGAVTGSISGAKTSNWGVSCTDPTGKVVEVAEALGADSFQAGLAGGVGEGGGFSASFSGNVVGTIQITKPFTDPGCVGKEPPLPAPSSTPISGTLSGTASVSGAITLTSSTGGSWSGTGSLQ